LPDTPDLPLSSVEAADPRAVGDQLPEVLHVGLGATLHDVQEVAGLLDQALGLVLERERDQGAVRSGRGEPHGAGVGGTLGRGPRDLLVRDLLEDRGVPLALDARDLGHPVQAAVAELPHLLDAAHE
jgi:hypothetical protein